MIHTVYKYVLVVLSILFLLKTGSAVKCYKCSDMVSISACKDPFRRNVDIVECGPVKFCGKLKREGEHGNYTKRGCMTEEFCNKTRSEDCHCSVCGINLCNAASIAITVSLFTVLYSIIAYVL